MRIHAELTGTAGLVTCRSGRAEPTLRVVVALRVVRSVRRDWTAGRETWVSKAGWVVYLWLLAWASWEERGGRTVRW